MNITKFIKRVTSILDTDISKKNNEKKRIKSLLKKLRLKRKDIEKLLIPNITKKEKKILKEELEMINIHIKKGENILKKLKMEA